MVRFLRFIVDHTLEGRQEPLKEYLIGCSVFDKPHDFDPKSDPLVRVEARRLRAKLHEYYINDGQSDLVVIELAGRGYTPQFTLQPAAARRLRERGRPLWPVLAAAAVLLATSAIYFRLMTHRGTAAAVREDAIVVLPFADLSSAKDQEYFSDGLTDEITNALSAVPGLIVIARTTAFQFKGRSEDVRAIAGKLRVELVLEGSVRKESDNVRVTVQLIEAATGSHIWSEQFDRKLTGVLEIQEDIARTIAERLRLDLPVRARGELLRGRTSDPEAYTLYLMGLHARFQMTPDTAEKSVDLFQKAIARDPNFSAAHAELAFALVLLTNLRALPAGYLIPRAKVSAINAIRADPRLADAHAALGATLLFEWDWNAAGREFHRALELNPNSFRARFEYAVLYLRALGRFSEAVSEMRKLRQTDPLSPVVDALLGRVLIEAGRFDEALEHLIEAAEVYPNDTAIRLNIGQAYLGKSMCHEATRELERARNLAGDAPYIIGNLGFAHSICGDRDEAKKLLQLLVTRNPAPETDAARIHAGLGDVESALACLRRAAEQRDSSLLFLRGDHTYGALLSDRRFEQLLFDRLRLPR